MTTTASAYVKGNQLCVLGLHESPVGLIPFSCSIGVELPDGPIDLQDEKNSSILDKAKKSMIGTIDREKMQKACGELVERARASDQNAMAMIAQIRDSAAKGNKRAKTAFRLLSNYIEKNPYDDSVRRATGDGSDHHYLQETRVIKQLGAHVGEDAAISAWTPGISDTYVAALVIADGPTLKKERVVSIGSHFGEDIPSFFAGFKRWAKNIRSKAPQAAHTGQAVGLARVLQGIRAGALPLSAISPMAGWEMGE